MSHLLLFAELKTILDVHIILTLVITFDIRWKPAVVIAKARPVFHLFLMFSVSVSRNILVIKIGA